METCLGILLVLAVGFVVANAMGEEVRMDTAVRNLDSVSRGSFAVGKLDCPARARPFSGGMIVYPIVNDPSTWRKDMLTERAILLMEQCQSGGALPVVSSFG